MIIYFFIALFFYACLIFFPLLGLVQVVDAIYMYTQKGKSNEYYADLEKYGTMVSAYFIGMALLFTPPALSFLDNHIPSFYMIYLFLLPIPMAIYKRRISKKEYFEPIEKLIF